MKWMIPYLLVAFTSCRDQPAFELKDLEPYPNRAVEILERGQTEAQPPRGHPGGLALSIDGSSLFVALQGSVGQPGDRVDELDAKTLKLKQRYHVGRGPMRLAMHPGGRYVVVTNRFSNYLTVIDSEAATVEHFETDFYASGVAFAPDGSRLHVTNQWRDAVSTWAVKSDGGKLQLRVLTSEAGPYGVPVGDNPRDVIATGSQVVVGAVGGMLVTSVPTGDALRATSVDVGAPVGGIAVSNGLLFVATLSASTHHPANRGPDTDGDGEPGDGTANVGFRDLQNELAVYDLESLEPLHRYTSDSICCPDQRDVSPVGLAEPSQLAESSTWIVEGALPEQLRVSEVDGEPVLVVAYSGSNQVQRFAIDPDTGALTPGPITATGFHPSGLVVDAAHERIFVSNRLGESVTIIDLRSFDVVKEAVVGDVSGGPFPATIAELGELYFFAGAKLSVDGDQTCNHCHRDQGNIGKAFSMPVLTDNRGARMTPASRGMVDSRPWFLEGAMDQSNFSVVINEFVRADNFCCMPSIDGDPYSTADDSVDSCVRNPPAECEDRPFPQNLPSRDIFIAQAADQHFSQIPNERRSVLRSFAGLTTAVGRFLIQEPAVLPNPNFADSPDALRGRELFRSASTGCAGCHPEPAFTVTSESPASMPLLLGPVISPTQDRGENLDLVRQGFLDTFPDAIQRAGDVFMNPPTLVGIWDRSPPFLHDGRAKNLREVLCTPGHVALRQDETGYNELDGIPDSHGGTSHLTSGNIADMIAYLLTL